MNEIVRFNDVEISFGSELDKHITHKNVNLSIKKGLSYVIVGRSGAGKSVLMKAMLGLLPTAKGEIFFNDEKIDFNAFRQVCGVQLQNGALLNSLNVLENVMLPLRYMGKFNEYLNDSELEAIAMAKLQMVGLKSEHYFKNVSELSGGMIKRVSLARAMALDPLLLIIDEPTSGLDQKSVIEYGILLQNLHLALELTTIMITHDLELAKNFAEMVIVIHEKHVYCDTYENILNHPVFYHYLRM